MSNPTAIPIQVPPDRHWTQHETIELEQWSLEPGAETWRFTVLCVILGDESGSMEIFSPCRGTWEPGDLKPGESLVPGQVLGRVIPLPGEEVPPEAAALYPKVNAFVLPEPPAVKARRSTMSLDPLLVELPPPPKVRRLVDRIREREEPPRYGRSPEEPLSMKRSRLYITEGQEKAVKEMVSALAEKVSPDGLRVTQAEVLRSVLEYARRLPEERLLGVFLSNRKLEAELGFGSASRSWE